VFGVAWKTIFELFRWHGEHFSSPYLLVHKKPLLLLGDSENKRLKEVWLQAKSLSKKLLGFKGISFEKHIF
jgi:hypothetical protein